ncbi:MAG: hypothetical protein CMO06_06935 [Thalassospira sp.]|uniref:outer membrane protein n=1 Tax=Thalassospira sp. TaxID=1912094 RepID=UPI000C66AE7B|nr:outer membrane beta-barrel protein [Thalassospira sp.]MAZ32865.1 hypothetical protein [Thalassospira sp.]
MLCKAGFSGTFACAAVMAFSITTFNAKASENLDWQGFYGGFALGGMYGASNPDSEAQSSGYFSEQSDLDQLRPGLQEKIDGYSASGSGLFGYDHRQGNMIYGIEADLTVMDYSETSNAGPVTFTSSPTIDFSTQTTVKTNFAFSIRPKIGYAFDNWMIHAAAGPSLSQFKYKFRYVDDNGSGQPVDFDETSWALGLSSNVGAAYNLGDGWSLRGDYVFNYYPEIVDKSQSFDRFVPLAAASFTGSFKHEADFQSHTIRFGLIKRF